MKSIFITPDETDQFKRMTFGLKTAPAFFWKFVHKLFHDLKRSGILKYYLDDMIILDSD